MRIDQTVHFPLLRCTLFSPVFPGFRKILKKHDKNLNTDAGARWRIEYVETAHFYTNKNIDKLIQETEACFISDLEAGDRQKAMKRLRVPPLGDKQSPWTTFKARERAPKLQTHKLSLHYDLQVGLFSGAFIVLLVAVVLSAIFHDYSHANQRDDWRVVFRLYRGPLLIILFIFLIAINVYGWR